LGLDDDGINRFWAWQRYRRCSGQIDDPPRPSALHRILRDGIALNLGEAPDVADVYLDVSSREEEDPRLKYFNTAETLDARDDFIAFLKRHGVGEADIDRVGHVTGPKISPPP
jgi:hypothetical protein